LSATEHKLFAVAGKPILHSRSPELYNGLFQRLQISASYTRLMADDVDMLISLYHRLGLAGLNVTTPFKQEIVQHLQRLDPQAAQVGAVNTVIGKPKQLWGFNTDVDGVLGALRDVAVTVKGQRVLILGVGGAGSAALGAVSALDVKPVLMDIDFSKAEQLARRFGGRAVSVSKLAQELQTTDILIVTLPEGVDIIDETWLPKHLIILEAAYKHPVLREKAQCVGCRYIPGEDWLLNQAIPAGRLFSGRPVLKSDFPILNFDSRPPARCIALIGFMAAGKTQVGIQLVKRLKWDFVDLDELIEQEAGQSIPSIFQQKGEAFFRQLESAMLEKAICQDKVVLACGGGIILKPDNCQLLRKQALNVWLFAGPETAVRRNSIGQRPLLEEQDPLVRARALFHARKPLYAATADVVVDAETLDVKQVCERIYAEIYSTLAD
jgi:shikimate dehydrogenase